MSTLRSTVPASSAPPGLPCPPLDGTCGDSMFYSWNPGLLTRPLLRLRASTSYGPVTRRKREMIPTDKKDSSYWNKRQKNNEAAKRSREKKRLEDLMLRDHLLALSDQNAKLQAQVHSLQYRNSASEEKRKLPAKAPQIVPTLSQSGFSGIRRENRSNPASVQGVRQQQNARPPFNLGFCGFDPQGIHTYGTHQHLFPLAGSSPHPQQSVWKYRSMEGEVDAPGHINTFLPIPDTLHWASTYLVPHVAQPVACSNFLLPLQSSHMVPSLFYPDLPLYVQERQKQSLSVGANGANVQREVKGQFSSISGESYQPRMQIGDDGC